MPRNYQRSFRLEDNLKPFIESLPHGSANSLVNELLREYQHNELLQKAIALRDARFSNYKPQKLVSMSLPFPDAPPPPVKPKRGSRVDDLMPGL